ncbi:MAG: VapE domain-containing protein [Terriglobales bacterium]
MTAPVLTPALPVYRVNLPSIPERLRQLPQWCLWRLEDADGKLTKVPFRPGLSRRASSTDSRTWVDFQTAASSLTGKCGLGFVLTPEAGVTFIDLDHVIDSVGRTCIWARRILEQVPSYAELSPSGTGVHLLVRGPALPQGRKSERVEMYSGRRFMTVTGDRLANAPTTIEERDVTWLFRLLDAGVFKFSVHLNLEKLLLGDWTGYPSQSEADLALCSILARKLDNPEDIDRAFRLSGLYREKWDTQRGSSTYGGDTIKTAMSGSHQAVYRPSSPSLSSPPTTGTMVEPATGSENWRASLLCTKDGAPKSCLANAITALRLAPEWQGVLGFDEFSLRVVLRQLPPWGGQAGDRDWTDVDSLAACEWLQHCGIAVSSRVTHEAVLRVADENRFHPVRSYLGNLTWDEVPRIEHWLSTYLGVPNDEFTQAVGKAWLVSGVARIFQPGCQADYTLLLEGPQGVRKSSALRVLAGDEWFTDHIATDFSNKDARESLRGIWICELSELASTRRSTVESVKSFLSCRVDHYRPPYGHTSINVPRQNVFAASTNDAQPLCDATGNRRFWPVRLGGIDVDEVRQDRDQLWAEAVKCYRAGEPWWLTTTELNAQAEAEQSQRYEGDSWDDVIESWIKAPQARSCNEPLPWFGSRVGKINISDVLLHALGKAVGDLRQTDQNRVARFFIHRHWERRKEGAGSFRGKWYYNNPESAKPTLLSCPPPGALLGPPPPQLPPSLMPIAPRPIEVPK